MKRHHPKQSSFDFGGTDDGSAIKSTTQISTHNRNSTVRDNASAYGDLAKSFHEGLDCPVPDRFPTGGTRRTYDALTALKAVERKDWRELQHLQFRWYCWTCNHWHEFSERFFNEFKGVYPHEC